MTRIFQPITAARQVEVRESLQQSALVSGDYLLFVVLSCVIATFGLVLDSGAVVIGAMLIAPLMPAILSLALGLVVSDLRAMGRALGTLLVGIVLAALLSAGLGLLVSGSEFNFLAQLPGEILNRTQPTLFDLAIALAGGAAAAYATAQPHLSATLPGVAIATALMPPMCVVGIGLAQGRWDVAGGAFLLFLANFVAIAFTSAIVFLGVGFAPSDQRRRRRMLPHIMALPGVMLLLVAVPLALFMLRISADANENNLIRTLLIEEVRANSARVGRSLNSTSAGRRSIWDGRHDEAAAYPYPPTSQ